MESYTQLAGLETLTIRPDSNFQMIGERTNVTGSQRFARLIRAGHYAEATAVALEQVRGGARPVLRLHQPLESLGTGDVGAFTNHLEITVGPDDERFKSRQSREMLFPEGSLAAPGGFVLPPGGFV